MHMLNTKNNNVMISKGRLSSKELDALPHSVEHCLI